MYFFRVFLHHSQFFHLPPTFIAKYPEYSTNQVCFPAKSLKKPPSAKQRWSQPGQAKPSQGVGGGWREEENARSGAASFVLRQQVLQALSEEQLLPEHN